MQQRIPVPSAYLNFADEVGKVRVDGGYVQLVKVDLGRVEGELDGKRELGVHQQGGLVLSLLQRSLLQLGLNLPDEGGAHPLLKLVGGRVQVENLDDLGDAELVAHVADAGHVLLALPGLQQLGRLYDWQQSVNDLGLCVLNFLVSGPLFKLSNVIPDLHPAGPVAHVLAQ